MVKHKEWQNIHELSTPTSTKNAIAIYVRAFMYLLLIVGCAELLLVDAGQHVMEERFSEYSYTEQMQSILLFAASSICLALFATTPNYRIISLLVFGLSSVSFFREQDVYFEQYLGRTTWIYPIIVVFVWATYQLIMRRKFIARELRQYITTFSAGVLFAAISTVYVFSRLFGRSVFWKTVLGSEYQRTAKAAAEEGVELFGYLLFFIAVIELMFLVRVKGVRE